MIISSIARLAEKQNRIQRNGIRIDLIKLEVEPGAVDQWKVSCFLDGNPLHMAHLPSFQQARMYQFRLLSFLREHAATYRKEAAMHGWLYVMRKLL